MSDFWNEIEAEDLPEDLRDLEREIGMDAVRHLVETWGGMQLYVQAPDKLRDAVARRVITEEWNGRNEGDLARRLGVSRRFVHDHLTGAPAKRTARRKRQQGPGLFGDE
ncbi:MAG: Mor transcription activator family protein [Bacteroidota bacterium]